VGTALVRRGRVRLLLPVSLAPVGRSRNLIPPEAGVIIPGLAHQESGHGPVPGPALHPTPEQGASVDSVVLKAPEDATGCRSATVVSNRMAR